MHRIASHDSCIHSYQKSIYFYRTLSRACSSFTAVESSFFLNNYTVEADVFLRRFCIIAILVKRDFTILKLFLLPHGGLIR
jgi:hypothetical protein